MLNRCVQYAAAHPERNHVFPRDFAYLAEKLGNDRQIEDRHLEEASFARWSVKGPLLVGALLLVETPDDVEDSEDDMHENSDGTEGDGGDYGDSSGGDNVDFMDLVSDDYESVAESDIASEDFAVALEALLFEVMVNGNDRPVPQQDEMSPPRSPDLRTLKQNLAVATL
jgi:hypothetical protein